MGIIKNRTLWATGSGFLNDPTEVSFAANALTASLQASLELEGAHHERTQDTIDLLERAYVDPHSPDQYREDRSFITSFSRSDQSLTLWRLYSGRNGFCIGFDEDQLLRWVNIPEHPSGDQEPQSRDEQEEREALIANYQLSGRVQDVTYGEEGVAPISEEVMSILGAPEDAHLHESLVRESLNKLSSIKHQAFRDEHEARLIVQEVHHHSADPRVRVSAAGALVAYREIVFPFEAVQSITLAPGANAPQQIRALESLMAQGGRGPYGHVDIRASDLPFVW